MSSFVCGVGTLRELSPEEMDEALREHIAQRNRAETVQPAAAPSFEIRH